MRTEKELWEVVLSRPDLFDGGICIWLINLFCEDVISRKELLIIDDLMCEERDRVSGISYWIGPKGQLQPRIDWINKQIKQLES